MWIQVGDRLKTAEEMAAEEEQRAEAAEKLRLKRARGVASDDEGDAGNDAVGASGGFAARRRRMEQEDKVSRGPHGPSGNLPANMKAHVVVIALSIL